MNRWLFIFILSFVTPSLADESLPFMDDKIWEYTKYRSFTFDQDGSDISLSHFGISKYFEKGKSFGIEGFVGRYDDNTHSPGDVYGLAIFLKYDLFKNHKTKVQTEIGAGLIHFDHDFPEKGTRTNFNPMIGLGIHHHIKEDWSAYFGARWHHISNAGRNENPGFDGAMIFFGLSHQF